MYMMYSFFSKHFDYDFKLQGINPGTLIWHEIHVMKEHWVELRDKIVLSCSMIGISMYNE